MNHIFISYSDGFPVCYTAANTKIRFIGKGLVDLGDNVWLINKFYSRNNIAPLNGEENGIKYVSFPNQGGKIKSAIVNTFKTVVFLKKTRNINTKNIVYVGCGNFIILAVIALFAKLTNYKVVFIYEEFQAGLELPFLYRINGYLHSYFLGYFADFIMPISEFLVAKSQRFKRPIFKLPICSDFTNVPIFSHEIKCDTNKYFLYCASAVYKKAFEFVIDAFISSFGPDTDIELHLILSGRKDYILDDINYIKNRNISSVVKIKTQIPYKELMEEYSNATGLLIPLFEDNIMDKARFSQKISEYLSTGRPVLSTNVGEIPYYFKNKENMFISEVADTSMYGDLMKYIVNHPLEANHIGYNGYELGKSIFDYRVLTKKISLFLTQYC